MANVKVTVIIRTEFDVESPNGVVEKQIADYTITNPVIDHTIVDGVKTIITEYLKDNNEESKELDFPS